jgi:hypothetical protein
MELVKKPLRPVRAARGIPSPAATAAKAKVSSARAKHAGAGNKKRFLAAAPLQGNEGDFRDVPELTDAQKAFYGGVTDHRDAFSVSAVRERFLKRYGTK